MGVPETTWALVTGGSRGIGAAVCRRLEARGDSIAFTYRHRADLADRMKRELEEIGVASEALQVAFETPAAVEQAGDAVARLAPAAMVFCAGELLRASLGDT